MAKSAYSIKRVSVTYAPFGAASFDCKNGLAESGVTIAMAENFGERTNGSDGSSMWSEYEGSQGTVTINLLPNSPVYAFFVNLQNAQRLSGTKGEDTMTIVNKSFNEAFTCANCAIESISGETFDKVGNTVRVITINAGEITKVAA